MPQQRRTTTKIRNNAKSLRINATKEENHLWYDFLSTYMYKFHRQYPIGGYILDFYCPKLKFAIELDGSQHYEDEGVEYDKKRTEYLNNEGIRVLRFSNLDINFRFNSVCETIIKETNL